MSVPNSPPKDLFIAIVIPCFNEKDNILHTLNSLFLCEKTQKNVEIWIIVNNGNQEANNIINNNIETTLIVKDWIKIHNRDDQKYFVLEYLNLPKKNAGVGTARKIGMDIAVDRFNKIGVDGVIINLDADCLVSPRYIKEVEYAFLERPKLLGASIAFEHRLDIEDNINAIQSYELHLRLYNLGLIHAGFPFAFHTVGSSMACRSSAYIKQGGMNRRKAGEDFYFIQKLLKLGNYCDLNTIKVYPSSRSSDRVPFGTGKAIAHNLLNRKQVTYAPEQYAHLKILLDSVTLLYDSEFSDWLRNNPDLKVEALKAIKLEELIKDARLNSKDILRFKKRLLRGLDGFRIMKLFHFCRINYWEDVDVELVARQFIRDKSELSLDQLLEQLRVMEWSNPKYLDSNFNVTLV